MMHRFNTSLGNNNQNVNDHEPYDHHQYADMYNQFTSSSSVDCTLSLGTPSTRLSEYDYNYNYNYNDKTSIQHDNSSDSCVSTFCWDSPHYNKNSTTSSSSTSHRNSSSRRGHNNNGNNKNVDDHLLAQRRCANCDTTSTPLWRNGPRGPKSLCNACGIRFKKEERRASGISQSQAQKMPCPNEFRFMDEDNEEPETGISFLSSWSLNVSEGPSFVHDFTRY